MILKDELIYSKQSNLDNWNMYIKKTWLKSIFFICMVKYGKNSDSGNTFFYLDDDK